MAAREGGEAIKANKIATFVGSPGFRIQELGVRSQCWRYFRVVFLTQSRRDAECAEIFRAAFGRGQ